jgi:nicotinamide mononucleotide transporter PnuC
MKQKASPTEKNEKINTAAMLILMCCTGVAITLTGIAAKQSFWRIAPLYVSLFIAFLQTRANRFAPLIGGINSILYAAVYFYYKLYASTLYALLFSCPIQIITFIRWNKKPYKESTVFRRLSLKQRTFAGAAFTAAWVITVFLLGKTGSGHSMLDTTISLIGILSSVLMALSSIEYVALMVLGQVFGIWLYIEMLGSNPEQITYLVYAVYSLICTIKAFVRVNEIYARQQEENIH